MSLAKIAVVGLGTVALLALSGAAGAQEWKWNLTPYVWASGTTVDVSVNDQDFLSGEVPFSDIIDNLDMAFEIDLKAQRGRHGVFFDGMYFSLGGDERRRPFAGPAGSELVAQGELEMVVADLGGIFNPRGDGEGFSLIYGARVLAVDVDLDTRIETPAGSPGSRTYGRSTTLYDALVGAHYQARFSERWLGAFRADLSAGQSEMTWSALAAVGYAFGEARQHALILGYRYFKMEFQESDDRAEVETRMALLGPFLACRFGF